MANIKIQRSGRRVAPYENTQVSAAALPVFQIGAMVEKGITEVRTDNEENNPMYKINVALGFKPVPFSLEYMKEI